MKEVTAKSENIIIYSFSDVIEDPYKVATETLYGSQHNSELREKFLELDSNARIDFLSQIVKNIK